MTFSTNPDIFKKNFSSFDHIRKNWGWFLGLGIFFIALGLLSIASAAFVTLLSVVFLGGLLLAAGVVQIVYTFSISQWSGFFLSLLSGILYAVVGFLLIAHPAAGALSLTLLLAALYIVGGIFRIVGSATMRFEHWGLALFSGIVKLVLGMLIWAGWPDTGLWVFGLFIGIDLVFYGWFWIMLALTAHNAKSYLR